MRLLTATRRKRGVSVRSLCGPGLLKTIGVLTDVVVSLVENRSPPFRLPLVDLQNRAWNALKPKQRASVLKRKKKTDVVVYENLGLTADDLRMTWMVSAPGYQEKIVGSENLPTPGCDIRLKAGDPPHRGKETTFRCGHSACDECIRRLGLTGDPICRAAYTEEASRLTSSLVALHKTPPRIDGEMDDVDPDVEPGGDGEGDDGSDGNVMQEYDGSASELARHASNWAPHVEHAKHTAVARMRNARPVPTSFQNVPVGGGGGEEGEACVVVMDTGAEHGSGSQSACVVRGK